jgi:two-component system, chemotaxis family, protein-glutamate methylesterase/glutaminase
MKNIIRVLVVDDSAYIRKVIKQMLSRSPFIEVVGTAHDGQEALYKVEQLKPDVVTLDLVMPEMDGIEFLKKQMSVNPLPVVVISIADQSSEKVLTALDAGAIDFIHKPTALATEKIKEMQEELVEKVKAASYISFSHLNSLSSENKPPTDQINPLSLTKSLKEKHKSNIDLIAIGISTGGPQALANLIPKLPEDLPIPVAIVLHMPVGYTKMYAERLNKISAITVKESQEGDILKPGMAFLAMAGRHLTFRRQTNGDVEIHLTSHPFDTLHRPSVDVMFCSAAEVFQNRVLGVVMTGMGEDGKEGSAWIKAKGGLIYTETESSCVVYGMPRAVDEAGLSDKSFTLTDLPQGILETL